MKATDKLLTAAEVAEIMRTSVRNINDRYAYLRGFPAFIKPCGKKLWKESEIMEYIEGSKRK